MSRRSTFRQSDLTRALKGAEAAGVKIRRLEIDPDGRLVLLVGGADAEVGQGRNPWDKVYING